MWVDLYFIVGWYRTRALSDDEKARARCYSIVEDGVLSARFVLRAGVPLPLDKKPRPSLQFGKHYDEVPNQKQ